MSNHPYLRAYMAGISVPTPPLLIPLTAFFVARFVYNIPVPVERVIIFPMVIIPNLFGVWNMLHLASLARTRLALGIHGAILPFISPRRDSCWAAAWPACTPHTTASPISEWRRSATHFSRSCFLSR